MLVFVAPCLDQSLNTPTSFAEGASRPEAARVFNLPLLYHDPSYPFCCLCYAKSPWSTSYEPHDSMTTFMFNGGLPPSPATSDDLAWDSSSSGLAFLSSQLVSHGFARPPGLVQPLSRLSREDLEPVSKCLRDLLEQRIVSSHRLYSATFHSQDLIVC